MAGEEEKEWLLPLNLFPPSSFCLSLLLSFVFILGGPSTAISHRDSFKQLSLSFLTYCLCCLLALHVRLLADMHTGSIAHLPNFSSSRLAPTPLLSASFSLLSSAPCITISRHALRESDEYFSSCREGLYSSSLTAFNTANGPDSVFSFSHNFTSRFKFPHCTWTQSLTVDCIFCDSLAWDWLDSSWALLCMMVICSGLCFSPFSLVNIFLNYQHFHRGKHFIYTLRIIFDCSLQSVFTALVSKWFWLV